MRARADVFRFRARAVCSWQFVSRRPDRHDHAGPDGIEAHRLDVDSDAYVIFRLPGPSTFVPGCLSRAEREVVRAVLDGKSNREIARQRGTSVRTVANQLHAVYLKCGLSGRLQLVRVCQRETAN